jgi:hypothetical protein
MGFDISGEIVKISSSGHSWLDFSAFLLLTPFGLNVVQRRNQAIVAQNAGSSAQKLV